MRKDNTSGVSLRVLLIQKDFKRYNNFLPFQACLRVLLIQKDFKRMFVTSVMR